MAGNFTFGRMGKIVGDIVGGSTVSIIGDKVIVDGVELNIDLKGVLTIKVEGVLENLTTDRSVNCESVTGDVTAGSSVNADSIGGSVEAGSSVNCDNIAGDVKAGSSVNCGKVGGSVTAKTVIHS